MEHLIFYVAGSLAVLFAILSVVSKKTVWRTNSFILKVFCICLMILSVRSYWSALVFSSLYLLICWFLKKETGSHADFSELKPTGFVNARRVKSISIVLFVLSIGFYSALIVFSNTDFVFLDSNSESIILFCSLATLTTFFVGLAGLTSQSLVWRSFFSVDCMLCFLPLVIICKSSQSAAGEGLSFALASTAICGAFSLAYLLLVKRIETDLSVTTMDQLRMLRG
jgi:NADH:ubiquinone oxidoreductase subunit K